ncbi:hypothetical protein HNR21_004799 [Actinomadura cellulosilytica]|uniref:Uncharacterized protein n=1 Tax=Thermomonospora cellulosilytica TaxID=1411118 RepID=A0A7W3N1T8_9ACTN|nr:hypothetical protein [Thermomonospora cellulosilytica]
MGEPPDKREPADPDEWRFRLILALLELVQLLLWILGLWLASGWR